MWLLWLACAVVAAAPAGAAGEDVYRGHGIAMHGEVGYPAGFEHFAYVNPQAPKGGELEQFALDTFDSFNGYVIKGNPAAGIAGIYDALMEASADEPFSMYGLLAETIETPADRSSVTFTLREGARWHDGRPIGVDDVIWTFETLLAKGAPFYRFYYGSVASVEKTGPRSVKFSFRPGENRELPLILGQLQVLPRHWWEGREFDAISEPPVGSGPYKVASFSAGRYVSYERVPDYWGAELPVNVGRHNFDRIRYEYYRDDTVALEAFKGGAFDFRLETNSKYWATAYDVPAVKQGLLIKRLFPHQRPAGMQGFALNLRRPLFQDPRVREALAYAFDFEWSNKTLFYGQYTRTRSYFDNSELAATGLPGPAELAILEPYRGRVPDEVFTREYQPPSTAGGGGLRANLRRAAELLKQAGWEVRDGALVHARSGEPFAFEILLVQPQFERIVLPFAKNLERLGIEARVRTVDMAQYRRRTDEFDFDATVAVFPQSESPGNEQRDFWGSAAAERPGSRNLIGLRNPVIDELVEKLIAAPDRAALVTRCRALDRVLQWGFYVVPHYHIAADRVAYWDKFGVPETTPRQGIQPDAWWVDAGKAGRLAPRSGQGG